MTIFETIGLIWVIFTSSLASIGVLYLSFIGLRKTLTKSSDVPSEVKELFKTAR